MWNNCSFIKMLWLHFVMVWVKSIIKILWFVLKARIKAARHQYISPLLRFLLLKIHLYFVMGGSFPSRENVLAHNSEMLQIKTSPAGWLKKQRGAIQPSSLCWPFMVSVISHGAKFNLTQLGFSSHMDQPWTATLFHTSQVLLNGTG